MNLTARIARRETLTNTEIDCMFQLMDMCYANISQQGFVNDLMEKEWVIILEDRPVNKICGFSTQMVFTHQCSIKNVKVLFSGDTIIMPKYWGSLALPVALGQLALELTSVEPTMEFYWLLTSKGRRTYRTLPVFFKDFWPRYDQSTPEIEAQLMRSIGEARYGTQYEVTRSVIIAKPNAQCMRPVLDKGLEQQRKDPHVNFFLHRNPGYIKGDELLCLAPLKVSNFSDFLQRRLQAATL